MHGIIPYMFDYWADPVVHLLLLKELHGSLVENETSKVRWSDKRTLTIGGSITVCLSLLFDWLGFDQTSKAAANSTYAKQLNPNEINKRSAVQ